MAKSRKRNNQKNIDEIIDVLYAHGDWAHGGEPLKLAEDWDDHDFVVGKVDRWLEARTFDPGSAFMLQMAGMTPKQAATQTDVGVGGYTDTIGYKVSNNDLSVDRAMELIGRKSNPSTASIKQRCMRG